MTAPNVIEVELEAEVALASKEDALTTGFWLKYAGLQIWEQTRVVWPLCGYVFVFKEAVLGSHMPTEEYASLFFAVNASVLGLATFLDGLQVGIMPLSETLGNALPRKASLPVTLSVAMVLGVGVTFAEPEIGALRTVGGDVDFHISPYLFELLNGWTVFLIAAVGAGVGTAATIGTLRFLKGWSLKPIIFWLLGVALTLSAAVHLLTENMSGIVGLAWDCGAVTTGPVTVPCVLALGVGVVNSAPGGNTLGPLSAFGLVTMASLVPVCTVLCLALFLNIMKSPQDIIEAEEARLALSTGELADHTAMWYDASPYEEIAAGTRALGPLVLFLCVTLFALREPLPRIQITAKCRLAKPSKSSGSSSPPRGAARQSADYNPVQMNETTGWHERMPSTVSIWPGVLMAYVGIILFNLGLNHGLAVLGGDAGRALPRAFMAVPDVEGTPYYSRTVGTAIVLAFAWVLGVGATLAEPSLTALGITVNRLTNGSFSPIVLRVAVPIGVGCGILSGVLVVLYEVPVTVLMFVAYPLTAWITVYCSEEFTNVAWDSAGVTTGSVTVPLVLSLGSGLSVATGARSGFGLLTMASVCPIISVLVCCFIPCLNRRPISGPSGSGYSQVGQSEEADD